MESALYKGKKETGEGTGRIARHPAETGTFSTGKMKAATATTEK